MGYEEALKAAGATVREFKDFGSYQGQWFALVSYNGEEGWISGYYGSCSGCDSFQAEFGWSEPACDAHQYDAKPNCHWCQDAQAKHQEKLADFGRGYLGGIAGPENFLKELDSQSEWDSASEDAAKWIRSLLSRSGYIPRTGIECRPTSGA